MEQQNLLNTDLQVDAGITMHLKETASWARFLGIVGYVISGIIAVVAFIVPSYLNRINDYGGYRTYRSSGLDDSMMIGVTVMYLLIAGICFMVAMFTYKFGDKTKFALQANDQVSLDTGLKNLKFLFRFYGVVTVIYLAFLVLALLGVGLTSAFR